MSLYFMFSGEWEQIFSRKDKKNRKPVASDEETTVEKSGKPKCIFLKV